MDTKPTLELYSFDNSCVSKLLFYEAGTGPYGCDVHLMYHNDRAHLAGPDCNGLWK